MRKEYVKLEANNTGFQRRVWHLMNHDATRTMCSIEIGWFQKTLGNRNKHRIRAVQVAEAFPSPACIGCQRDPFHGVVPTGRRRD